MDDENFSAEIVRRERERERERERRLRENGEGRKSTKRRFRRKKIPAKMIKIKNKINF